MPVGRVAGEDRLSIGAGATIDEGAGAFLRADCVSKNGTLDGFWGLIGPRAEDLAHLAKLWR
jgi:hypothetical protein